MNNDAPELSPEARRIISAARGSDDPTPEDHDRVKARWLAGVAAVAGVSSLTEAARAAGGIGWGIKAVGAAFAVVAGAIGIYVALPVDRGTPGTHDGTTAREAERAAAATGGAETQPTWRGVTHERFEKTPLGSSKPVAAPAQGLAGGAPEVAAPEAVVVEAVPEVQAVPVLQPEGAAGPEVAETEAVPAPPVAVEPAVAAVERPAAQAARRRAQRAAKPAAEVVQAPAPVAPPAAAPPAAAAAGPGGQLGEELALLNQVRSSVQSGSAGQALQLLSDYEKRFGKPILGMEADALRVDALCRSGQRDAAREKARAFQNEWPGSPLERRVSAACP